ncbi:FAD-dependent monooxygenase [Streptomyces sp. DT2A-34]|uniref:FAD-dependent monooxygenase n=1 Tax=Streptomyces sp. DT2A-34 TaxID=3051182 RepID=UPI00265C5EF8|nr:FAD-dependent monooxygenase [Streptomyces sp. DT2A-34]MDO0910443.1 FAD-dependent monooxygenase [Streptomyces sp. DT2A-34]
MTAPLDVLVVGAGPTGLALAAQLRAHGITFRLVDRSPDRVRESRALGIQPRTLEALAGFGVTERLVARGNPAMRLRLHLKRRTVSVPLFDIGLTDTPYPFLLFLSQAETENVLGEHLATRGVPIERGTELLLLDRRDPHVVCRLRGRDGTEEDVVARYVVGCDGAHSTVRAQAGIDFEGYAYPQTYLLADLDVDGLEPGAVHSYMTGAGMLIFFPLGSPAPWRMLAIRPPDAPDGEVTLPLLRQIADRYGAQGLTLRDPVWMTDFRLHNRGAARYRSGPCFLAGDAAHIHSPAGAQGMNTGIQDALNLGWKLALVCRGAAPEELLQTYGIERAPVGREVRRFTDRAFTVGTSPHPLLRFARARLVPHLAPLAVRARAPRRWVFRTVSELGIHYRRSPASTTGGRPPRHGPRAGDRLPDLPRGIQARTAAPGWHLLLTGPPHLWPDQRLAPVLAGRADLITVHRLDDRGPWPGVAQGLVRPDGHVGYVARGAELEGLRAYAARWLPTDTTGHTG